MLFTPNNCFAETVLMFDITPGLFNFRFDPFKAIFGVFAAIFGCLLWQMSAGTPRATKGLSKQEIISDSRR